MKHPVLKDMLQNERHVNFTFGKGRRRTLMLILICIALRFADPIAAAALGGVPLKLEFNLIPGFSVAVCVGWVAMLGNVKLAGFLCLLTPTANVATMVSASKLYSGGFVEMVRRAPVAWYILVMSVVCAAIGIVLLLDKTIAAYGKRRKEIQKEYAAALKTWANETKRNHETPSEPFLPGIVTSPKVQADARQQEPAAEKTSEEAAGNAKDDLHRQTIAAHLAELEAEPFTLVASSIPNAASKVSKQRFFDLFREMVCKQFRCRQEEVDPATYILVFPGNELAFMRWFPEEKKIVIESNTKRYGAPFHALMIEVISYLSKNMGVKFDITDIAEQRNTLC